MIGRSETNEAIAGFFCRFGGGWGDGVSLVPMGGPKDGSSIVGYYARTAAAQHQCELRDLDSALVKSHPIVFVDDFIGLGSTVITFFEGLLGLPDTQDLGQDRPAPLDDEIAERLKSRPIAVVFSAGLDGAEDVVKEKLTSYGFTDLQLYVHRRQDTLPTLATALNSAPGADAFIAECRRIGSELLTEGERDPDWVEGRSLGYGNHGLLIAFPYNTPAATLTALWKAGTVDGQPWLPLIPRLKKT